MGVEYYVVCRDCGIIRDLDKFYSAYPVENRSEALAYAGRVKEDAFRFGLLGSFMAEHRKHNCSLVSEYDIEYHFNDWSLGKDLNRVESGIPVKEDTNFWIVE